MQAQSPRPAGLLILAASALTFLACRHFAARALIEQQQTKQLQELGAVALRRAKNAADYGAATLDRLNLRGPISCNPSVRVDLDCRHDIHYINGYHFCRCIMEICRAGLEVG